MVSSPYYDNQLWEYHLPINPPIHHGIDIDVTGEIYMYSSPFEDVQIMNWNGTETLEFHPRVRERNDWIDGGRKPGLEKGIREASDNDAPELDLEYDCD